MIKSLGSIALTFLISMGITSSASAVSLTEGADAGNLVIDAGQTNTQPAGTTLDSIVGTLNPAGDIDLWQIYVPGGAFSASTVGNPAILDTQLFLFDNSGIGVYASNDAPGDPNFKSTISIGSLATGTYYIGISSFGSDPQSSGGLIFDLGASDPATFANGPGGGSSLNSWSTNLVPEAGNYSIVFNGAQFSGSTAAVPFEFNPMLGLLILGTWGAWQIKKRK